MRPVRLSTDLIARVQPAAPDGSLIDRNYSITRSRYNGTVECRCCCSVRRTYRVSKKVMNQHDEAGSRCCLVPGVPSSAQCHTVLSKRHRRLRPRAQNSDRYVRYSLVTSRGCVFFVPCVLPFTMKRRGVV